MRDLPIGLVVATVSVCAAVVMVCFTCLVAWAPSFKDDTVFVRDEDEPVEPVRHGAPPAHIVNFHARAAKGFGQRKGRSS